MGFVLKITSGLLRKPAYNMKYRAAKPSGLDHGLQTVACGGEKMQPAPFSYGPQGKIRCCFLKSLWKSEKNVISWCTNFIVFKFPPIKFSWSMAMPRCFCTVQAALTLQQQRWVVTIETTLLMRAEWLTLWPFWKVFAGSCLEQGLGVKYISSDLSSVTQGFVTLTSWLSIWWSCFISSG